jgi:membrane associated rhomboid family serine protease
MKGRLDRLAAGLAATGMLHGPPLRLVAIAVFPHGMNGVRPRSFTGLTPNYYAGLRPKTWAADLADGRLHRGRLNAEGASDVASALVAGGPAEVLDPSGVAVLERENAQRAAAFYRLMQRRVPIVTYILVAANVAIFLLGYLYGAPESDATLKNFGALSPRLIEQGQWWRLCSAIFLHASIPHILFNMTSLFVIGTLAERLYGSGRFLAIYLGSGLLGSLTSFFYAVLTNNLDILGVGASGAIFGVAGALVAVRFHDSEVIPRRLRERISTSLLPLIILNLGVAFVTPHVDNSAHIGGLLGGAALSFLFPVAKTAQEV